MSKKIKLNQEDIKALTDLNNQKKILRDKLVTIALLELEVEDKKDEVKNFRKNINAIQSGLGQKLDEAQESTQGAISWIDTLGLRQVKVDQNYLQEPMSLLNKFYGGIDL